MLPRKPASRPNPASDAASPEPESAEQELERLDRAIERFRAEAERFLNGVRNEISRPDDRRLEVTRQLRELRERNLKTAGEQYRLTTLEGRFNALTERFGRRLRDLEEGSHAAARPAAAAPRHDPEAGIVLDAGLDREAVAALAAGLVRHGGSAPDLETFRDYLGRQLAALQAKTGHSRVQFRLAVEDGKAKLKAKPLGGDAAGSAPAERVPT